jgi:hypothetical protein
MRSHVERSKSTNVLRSAVIPNNSPLFFSSCIYFQFFCFPQLKATRAVSGRSVPIITCLAAGAGAIIRFFGPESIGGRADFSGKFDADVNISGLSEDEIGRKVHFSYIASRWTK